MFFAFAVPRDMGLTLCVMKNLPKHIRKKSLLGRIVAFTETDSAKAILWVAELIAALVTIASFLIGLL